MGERTENVLLGTFGAIRELESGDMIVDRNEGELVPADQILKDPDHLEKIDLLKEDGLGCLRCGPLDEEDDDDRMERLQEEELTELTGEQRE